MKSGAGKRKSMRASSMKACKRALTMRAAVAGRADKHVGLLTPAPLDPSKAISITNASALLDTLALYTPELPRM